VWFVKNLSPLFAAILERYNYFRLVKKVKLLYENNLKLKTHEVEFFNIRFSKKTSSIIFFQLENLTTNLYK
jgi:hypothetical protein